MTVRFYDKARETYETIDNVVYVKEGLSNQNGHLTKFWFVHTTDGKPRALKCRDYSIHWISEKNV